MQNEIELQTPTQWKAVSHPLRVGILRLLVDKAHTNEELACALNVASGKLYFHTKRLLEAGLIVPAGTRPKGPLIEKLYTAVARTFVAPRTGPYPPDGKNAAPLIALLQSGMELYQTTWEITSGLPDDLHYGFSLLLPQSPEKRREFVSRLQSLFNDFKNNADASADALNSRAVSLNVLMHSVPPSIIPVLSPSDPPLTLTKKE